MIRTVVVNVLMTQSVDGLNISECLTLIQHFAIDNDGSEGSIEHGLGARLDKRQCTFQLCFPPDSSIKVRIAISKT